MANQKLNPTHGDTLSPKCPPSPSANPLPRLPTGMAFCGVAEVAWFRPEIINTSTLHMEPWNNHGACWIKVGEPWWTMVKHGEPWTIGWLDDGETWIILKDINWVQCWTRSIRRLWRRCWTMGSQWTNQGLVWGLNMFEPSKGLGLIHFGRLGNPKSIQILAFSHQEHKIGISSTWEMRKHSEVVTMFAATQTTMGRGAAGVWLLKKSELGCCDKNIACSMVALWLRPISK